MQRVSSLDAGMLYAETPEMPMHTMGVLTCDIHIARIRLRPCARFYWCGWLGEVDDP